MNTISIDECINVLEAAIGEAEHVLPEAVLNNTIEYLKAYKEKLRYESWDVPEADAGFR